MRSLPVLVVATIGLLLAPAGTSRAEEPEDATHVHALLVADTDDPKIGASVGTDLSRMRLLLELGIPEARRTLTVLEGADATAANVRRHYEHHAARPHEAHVFFYAGHGQWRPGGPDLLLPGGEPLARAELRALLARHAPRLLVVLTDCCSTYVGMAAMARMLRPDPDTFRDLLFRHRGIVDVTAAKEGQAAVGNGLDGGYFTTGLMQTLSGLERRDLDGDRDGIVSWQEALDVVRGQTESAFDMFHPEGLRVGGKLQTGQAPVALAPLAASVGRVIPRSRERLGVQIRDTSAGAEITGVVEGSPAAWSGLRVGERIRALVHTDVRGEVQDHEVTDRASLARALEQVGGPEIVEILLAAPGEQPELLRSVLVHLAR